jgi:7,8-dihydroneopterin aldolase/epimerase/oxygenase
MLFMAKIRIHNMMFYGFHGIYEYEREQGQKFYVDVEMVTRDDKAELTDDPKDGVDTALVYTQVKDVVENKRFMLLQALAVHVNEQLLKAYPQIGEVTTCVRKPSVPISGPIDYVEVEATSKAK